MARTTITLDEALARRAHELGINVSAAARQGVAGAVRAAMADADRRAYLRSPERPDRFWTEAEVWTDE